MNLFEIGVGGYDDPYKGGESLRMWKEYFKKGMIFSVDINEKTGIEEDRISIYRGSQTDTEFLRKISLAAGGLIFS